MSATNIPMNIDLYPEITISHKRTLENPQVLPKKRIKLDPKVAAIGRPLSAQPILKNRENFQFDRRISLNDNASNEVSFHLQKEPRKTISLSPILSSCGKFVGELKLRDCIVMAKSIDQLASCFFNLQKLYIVQGQITQEAIAHLKKFPTLKELQLIKSTIPGIPFFFNTPAFHYTTIDDEPQETLSPPNSTTKKKEPPRPSTPPIILLENPQEDGASLNQIASSTIRNFILSPFQQPSPIIQKLIDSSKELINSLDLSSCSITPQIIEMIAKNFPHITELCLEGCIISDNEIRYLAAFTELQRLDLSNTTIEGTTLAFLPRSLSFLSLQDCVNLKENFIQNLTNSSIECLNISGAKIRGKYFSALPATLKIFDLAACPNIADQSLEALSKLRLLQKLDLSFVDIFGTYFKKLPRSLQTLLLVGCQQIGDQAISALSHTALEELRVGETAITGKCFAFLPETLRYLAANDCKKLDETALQGLAKTNLETLDISRSSLHGDFFNFLPRKLRHLFCVGLTLSDSAIAGVSDMELETLYIETA
jgi:hypothetical protein